MFRWLAEFAMQAPSRAVMVAVTTALLFLLFPPIGYLSGAVVGLVTLHHGVRGGIIVASSATVISALLGMAVVGSFMVAPLFLFSVWLPVILVTSVLRSSQSLKQALYVTAQLGIIAIVVMYIILENPAQWWQDIIRSDLLPILLENGVEISMPVQQMLLDDVAEVLTGILIASSMIGILITLFIARSWQAQLYNPGGFQKEFHSLKIGSKMALPTLALIAVAVIADGLLQQFARDILHVALILFLMQGLAVVHALVAIRGMQSFWLISMYAIAVIALPQITMVLSVLGFSDSWLHLRQQMLK